MTERIAIIKAGWSEDYQGGTVTAAHSYVREHGEGHERFNFLPGPDGRFYGYIPPIGPSGVPIPPQRDGWLLVFVAKKPERAGLYIVGWYEDARFVGTYRPRPEYARGQPFERDWQGNEYNYTVVAPHAVMVPETLRTERLNTNRIRTTPVAYLLGWTIREPWREQLAREVVTQIRRLGAEIASSGRPSIRSKAAFPQDPKYRADVEAKSMAAAQVHLEQLGYKVDAVHLENRGYDLLARRKRDPRELHVEVKGTGTKTRQFFMTKKEYNYMREAQWRLAIVTDALGKPKVEIMDERQVMRNFSFDVLQWQALENGA